LLAFARSLGDVGITMLIAGNLPGATPACVLVLVISAAVWIMANRLGPGQATR
jgi:ABC-type molybdate transport system permease subunit